MHKHAMDCQCRLTNTFFYFYFFYCGVDFFHCIPNMTLCQTKFDIMNLGTENDGYQGNLYTATV